MKCPRCYEDLSPNKIDDIDISCCQNCSGVLLKQRNLNRVLKVLCDRLEHKFCANTLIDSVPDVGEVVSCPECASSMENYGYMESNKVLIDYCDNCNSIWLDTFELLAMVDMYGVSMKYQEYLNKTAYEGADLMASFANSQAAMKGLVWGALNIIG